MQIAQLQELRSVLIMIMKRISWEDSHQKIQLRLVRQTEHLALGALLDQKRYLRREIDQVLRKISRIKDPDDVIKKIDWNKLGDQAATLWIRPLAEIAAKAATQAVRPHVLKQQAGYDWIYLEAVNWASDHTGELIKPTITEDLRQSIRQQVQVAIGRGDSIGRIKKDILDMGLEMNYRQLAAHDRLRSVLERKGLAHAEIDNMLKSYQDKAVKYRARMIARTETSMAMNDGTLLAYQKYNIQFVKWIAYPGCCDICRENKNKVFDVRDAFGKIPAHPQCGCTWVSVLERQPSAKRTLRDVEENIKKKLNLYNCDLTGLTIKMAQEVESALLKLHKRFRSRLKSVRIRSLKRGVYANCIGEGHGIQLGSAYWRDRAKLLEAIKNDSKGFYAFHPDIPDEDLIQGILYHEYAHSICATEGVGSAPETIHRAFWYDCNKTLNREVREPARELQRKYPTYRERSDNWDEYNAGLGKIYPSRYCHRDDEELVAEAFVDGEFGLTKVPVSKTIHRLIKEHYGKGKD